MARLHRGGRTRAWIGRLLGGDEALGDRAWRRVLHLAGAAVLLVYVLPSTTFGPVPVRVVLVAALGGVLLLEALRLRAGWELPTIRPHEEARVASFALYAVGLVVSVLLFPEPIAVAVVLGAAVVDPVLGELRQLGWSRAPALACGLAVYLVLATGALLRLSPVPGPVALGLGALGAAAGVLVEGPRSPIPLDDDLAMTLVPGALLTVLWLVAPAAGAAW